MWSRCGRDVVAVRSRCGRDVVAMWWCYWTDAPCIRHAPYCDVQDANEMRMVENTKRDERHTGRIRDDSDIKKKRIVQINPPPLMMGGGGD